MQFKVFKNSIVESFFVVQLSNEIVIPFKLCYLNNASKNVSPETPSNKRSLILSKEIDKELIIACALYWE